MPEPIHIKDHENEKRMVNKRLLACALLVAAISCALVVRLYILQVVEFDYHSTISENNRVHVLPITPTRGLIYDRKQFSTPPQSITSLNIQFRASGHVSWLCGPDLRAAFGMLSPPENVEAL